MFFKLIVLGISLITVNAALAAPVAPSAICTDQAIMQGTPGCERTAPANSNPAATNYEENCSVEMAELDQVAPDLSRDALHTALLAYEHARAYGYDSQEILTIVDYTKPSNVKRLWILDLKNNKLIYHGYVAHGTQSGRLYATQFSDRVDSHKSVIGVLLTGDDYQGTLGHSLHLYGLEPGFNDTVYKRKIVMHPASYVNPQFIQHYNEAGKSFGCLAISPDSVESVISYIKGGTIIVNYYPNKQWLEHSKFLH